jgi:hypothetical protein
MKFKRKDCTCEIEAYKFNAGHGPQEWPEGWMDAPHSILGDGKCTIWNEAIGVNLIAEDGSWIIKHPTGGFHITNDNYFMQMYEQVSE